MHNITLVSTVHKAMGKCNANELYKIIENIRPEVIFLEALDNTYSSYQKILFSSYGIFHQKLEICAIQKYSHNAFFVYVPVLDIGLSDAFDKKYKAVCEYKEWQKLIDNFNFLAAKYGFKFLNSLESINLQEKMRMCEARLLNDSELGIAVNEDIDVYENSMISNIYSYCRNSQFNSAIFLCGVAHRKSIIDKTVKFNAQEKTGLNWVIFKS